MGNQPRFFGPAVSVVRRTNSAFRYIIFAEGVNLPFFCQDHDPPHLHLNIADRFAKGNTDRFAAFQRDRAAARLVKAASPKVNIVGFADGTGSVIARADHFDFFTRFNFNQTDDRLLRILRKGMVQTETTAENPAAFRQNVGAQAVSGYLRDGFVSQRRKIGVDGVAPVIGDEIVHCVCDSGLRLGRDRGKAGGLHGGVLIPRYGGGRRQRIRVGVRSGSAGRSKEKDDQQRKREQAYFFTRATGLFHFFILPCFRSE